MNKILLILCLAACWRPVAAQTFSGNDVKEQLVTEWQRARAYTLEYLDAVPAEKYSFRPTDSVRNFAEQMLHLAATNVFFISTATGKPVDWPGTDHNGKMIPQGKDSVVAYVLKSYDYVIAGIKDMDPARFGEVVGPARIRATRYAYLLKGFEHQTHHRGQTTVYIRLMGIRPPPERLF